MINCKICLAKIEDKFKLSVKEMMQGTREMFDYFRCPNCECLQIAQIPGQISNYYSNYYTENKIWLPISTSKKFLRKARTLISLTPLYYIISLLRYNQVLSWLYYSKINLNSKILDVGCGSGDLLFDFSQCGFKDLTGVDSNLENEGDFNGIRLINRTIFEINGKFDLIIFNHSLEHTWEQHEAIGKAKQLLNHGGVISVRMPIVNYAFKLYKENWIQIDAPRHFLIHSLKSFYLLCKQHGLRVFKYKFDSTEFQFMGSEQYKKNIPLCSPNSYKVNFEKSIFTNNDLITYRKNAKKLNKLEDGDQAVFFIKKNEKIKF